MSFYPEKHGIVFIVTPSYSFTQTSTLGNPYFYIANDMAHHIEYTKSETVFEWDTDKDEENLRKHKVSFKEAACVFADPNQIIAPDRAHSCIEERFYCFGAVAENVMTVRFTYRNKLIRIIGAGYWRKGRKFYEKAKKKSKIYK